MLQTTDFSKNKKIMKNKKKGCTYLVWQGKLIMMRYNNYFILHIISAIKRTERENYIITMEEKRENIINII